MKKRKDGLYQVRMTIDGKQKSFYGKTKKEAEAKKLDFLQNKKYSSNTAFKKIGDAWAEGKHKNVLNATWEKTYNSPYNYIIDKFGDCPIEDITYRMLQAFIDNLPTTSKGTSHHYLLILKQIFNFAVNEEIILYNPATNVKVSNFKKTNKRLPLTENEVKVICENVNNKDHAQMALFAYIGLYTGMRKGELLALTWNDIDFENKMITVDKAVSTFSNKAFIKSTKTDAGLRSIVIPDKLLVVLKERAGEGLLFPYKDGSLINDNVYRRLWEKYVDSLGLNITAHQLRHTYATFLYDAGVDLKTAQEQLGHTDVKTTMGIYTHLTEERKKASADILNKYLNSK